MKKKEKEFWEKFLPKSKREQKEIFGKCILYDSSAWRNYVDSEDHALLFLEQMVRLMEKKGIDPKVGCAVILNLADEKLGKNEGVGHLKSVLKKVLEE